MDLAHFLEQLVESGRVEIDRAEPHWEAAALEARILAIDATHRLCLPCKAPQLDIATTRHAALVFAAACAGLVHRDLGPEVLAQRMRLPFPPAEPVSAAYSADLVLRFLPELESMVRAVASEDVLVVELGRLAESWPLSSVGVGGVTVRDLAPILNDPCLRWLYCDRIVLKSATDRLSNPAVLAALAEAVGEHPELCGTLAERIRP